MATYTRANAWDNGGTFNNADLLWYAKGVGVMQSRALDDQNSWWFFAAIHGHAIGATVFPGWGGLPSPPGVPTAPLPSENLEKLYWKQCQHQSWFFPPWHRGYLIALEAQIRAAIINLGGPSTWALPYWNYFGPDDENEMPPAFGEETLPNGSSNPLFVTARYGPNRDGNIFIPIPPVSDACQTNPVYTGSDATLPPGFGGLETGFWHGGGSNSGNLELNPHNLVHVFIGGRTPDNLTGGLMSNPRSAALDPIFYLHHCNIDRMWAAWINKGNTNPTEPNWLNGPTAAGDRKFAMPMPDGSSWVYTPTTVNNLSQLDYTYDDLTAPVPVPPSSLLTRRLIKLGATPAAAEKALGVNMESQDNAELVGANVGALRLKSSGARATVKLDSDVRRKVSASLAAASASASAEAALPDQVYLELENVRGNDDSFILDVSVNQKPVGTVGLFGLEQASQEDDEHGGGGLNFVFDITRIIDNLFLDNALDLDSLDVRIVPNQPVPDTAEITVGRVSVFRRGQQ